MRGSARPRLVLALLVLTALTLITLDVRAGQGSPLDGLRGAADAVLGPPQRAVGAAARAVGGAAQDAVQLGRDGELERLRAENERLAGELRTGEAQARRLAELDALLGAVGTGATVPARVTAFGSGLGFEQTITLDVGSGDGVRAGQTVRNGAGLVGRTVRVGPASTVVLLLVDPGFSVGTRLAREGTLGLARGGGDGTLTFTQVEGDLVQVEEVLLTTGSQTFVPGVPVGRIERVDPARGALTPTATVLPFADLSSLDLVGVVVEPQRTTPRPPLEPDEPAPSPLPPPAPSSLPPPAPPPLPPPAP